MYNCHQSLHRTVSHMEKHKKLFPLFQLDFQGLYVPVYLTHPSTIVKMINSRREKLSYGIHTRWSLIDITRSGVLPELDAIGLNEGKFDSDDTRKDYKYH